MTQRLNENGKLFETNFGELGLQVKFIEGVESPLGETYLYDLVYVSQYNKNYLNSLLEKIAIYHHLDMKIIKSEKAHFGVFVSIPQEKLSLIGCIAERNQRDIVIGKDNLGKPMILNFDKIPHLLIAGTTGSGKSVLLHNLIANLYLHYGNIDKRKFGLVIIDPKGNELDKYKNCQNAVFVDNTNMAISVLEKLVANMDYQYQNNIKPNYETFIVIDELADLMLTSKFKVEESVVRLAQKGRALGIHLIVATQRPTVDVVSGLIKANMPYRIALKTASIRDSIVILDHKQAETLNVGEAIVKLGVEEHHIKIAYPENELIAKVVDINK